MSFASYPWNSTAEIRAHFHMRRQDNHERYVALNNIINAQEADALAEHRKLEEIARAHQDQPTGGE